MAKPKSSLSVNLAEDVSGIIIFHVPFFHLSSFIFSPNMPTYEYRCKFCHHITDAFQRMSEAPLVKCPHCGKDGLERIVSGGAGVIYKGEGWYVTDYSKKSSGGKEADTKTESTSDSSKNETAKKDSTKTETPSIEAKSNSSSKPESSSESKTSKE
jgi:putative FmdB family regulatory protein